LCELYFYTRIAEANNCSANNISNWADPPPEQQNKKELTNTCPQDIYGLFRPNASSDMQILFVACSETES
jgi:hypothetical protein